MTYITYLYSNMAACIFVYINKMFTNVGGLGLEHLFGSV